LLLINLTEEQQQTLEKTRMENIENRLAYSTELEDTFDAFILAKHRKKQVAKLKAKCKELAAAGVDCRKKINETAGKERYDAWDEKRKVGRTARIHYIAYGLLRGRDYGTIEPKVNDQGDCYAVTFRAERVAKVLQEYCTEAEHDRWTKEHVEELLRKRPATKVRSDG
jgi:hypothetical protein